MIYLDNHATTRVDPRVVQAMHPYWSEEYGNAGSVEHGYGERARAAVAAAREDLAAALGASPREIVFTSGATESNNLALKGVVERLRVARPRLISVVTEHPSVLDPLARLARHGCDVELLPVHAADRPDTGQVDLDRLDQAVAGSQLVSVMLANNEIGVLQRLADIGRICRARGAILHCDATQAVGKMPLDVREFPVDLLSFTAHKVYGPKGVGALYVRRDGPRLAPLVHGGGQEWGLRSGTLNVPAIVGFAAAVRYAMDELPDESLRLAGLRQRLFGLLAARLPGLHLNGPTWGADTAEGGPRLPGNLNVSIDGVDGDALLAGLRGIAVSSGSACSSANPEPSHVLRALGRSEALVRASLRFGIGRFNTKAEIDQAAEEVIAVVERLRAASGGRAPA